MKEIEEKHGREGRKMKDKIIYISENERQTDLLAVNQKRKIGLVLWHINYW